MSALAPTDIVPRIRSDVFIADVPPGTGEEFVEVKTNGHHAVRLRGFEVSLARMLDGQHTAREVVDRAHALGLPLQLASLDGLIHDFDDLGLLAKGEARATSPWLERTPWSNRERVMFRAALRKARGGQFAEARDSLDQLLADSPNNDEALRLRRALEGANPQDFRDAYLSAQREWLKHTEPTRDELKSVRSSTVPWVVMTVLLACVAISLLIPFPRVVTAPARLSPITLAPVDAARDGTVGELTAAEGKHVEAGDTLFTWDDGTPVVAPQEGIVENLAIKSGGKVADGQRMMTIEDVSSLALSASLPDSARGGVVKPGQTLTLNLDDHSVQTKVESVENGVVKAVFDNSARDLDPGSAQAVIEVAPASIAQRLW